MDELDDMLLALIYDLDLKDGTMNGTPSLGTKEFNDQSVPEEAHLPSRLLSLRETVTTALANAQVALGGIEGHRPTAEAKASPSDSDPNCALNMLAAIQQTAELLLQTTNELRNVVEPRQ